MTPQDQPREIGVDELMARVRAEVVRRRQSVNTPDKRALTTVQKMHATVPSDALRRDHQLPFSKANFATADRYVLNDLLALHDEDFVTAAYRALLRRAPDQAGLNHFLQSLRRGEMSKVEVLGRLRYSPEGRRNRVPVRNLAVTFAVQHSYRLPLVGPVIAMGTAAARLPRIVRSLQAFEGYQHHRNKVVATVLDSLVSGSSDEQSTRDHVEAVAEDQAALRELITALGVRVELASQSAQEAKTGDEATRELIGSQFTLLLQETQRAVQVLQQSLASTEKQASNALSVAERSAQELRGVVEAQRAQFEQRERVAAAAEMAIKAVRLEAEAARGAAESAREQLGSLSSDFGIESERALREREHVQGRLAELQGRVEEQGLRMLDGERRLWQLLSNAAQRQPSLTSHAPVAETGRLEALYFALEQRFRGSREDIRQRLSYYLPMLRAAIEADQSIVDIGCGRGEWLEMLKDEGYSPTGVDTNESMVVSCTHRGLTAVTMDALSYLRTLPDHSVGCVSGFHLIEHVGVEMILGLLDEARRVLLPGGLLILETPNPENVSVGACSFWIDPSHRHPIPPVLAQFMVETRGFQSVEIHRVNAGLVPSVLVDPAEDESPALLSAMRLLRHTFEIAPDYAVVGRAP